MAKLTIAIFVVYLGLLVTNHLAIITFNALVRVQSPIQNGSPALKEDVGGGRETGN